jgi:hypothetical protein
MRAPLLALGLLALTGCGPNLVGLTGDTNRLDRDFEMCRSETFKYAFIPDFGATAYINESSCMQRAGWIRADEKLMGWRWLGRPE